VFWSFGGSKLLFGVDSKFKIQNSKFYYMGLKSIMNLLLASTIVAVAFSFSVLQDKDKWFQYKPGEKFEKEWKKVEELDKKGLPKSALDIVSQIYEKSKKTNNTEQYLKAMIYRMKFINAVEENSFENLIKDLEAEIKNARFPSVSVMHSMLAEMYWMYYQGNRWKFRDRTAIENYESDDIKTWDLQKLSGKVIDEYLLSLKKSDSLQHTPLAIFHDILTQGNQPGKIRPSLYDFLVNRAIDFFADTRLSLTEPADKFELKEEYYFDDCKVFSGRKITTNDTTSLHFYAVKLFQELLSFRAGDDNIEALIDADLKRLRFMYDKSVNIIKDSLYLNSLQRLEKQYSAYPVSADINYCIAKFLQEKSDEYNPFDEKTGKYRYYNKQALDICNQVIKNFPGSAGAKKCESLVPLITNLVLQFESEKVTIPGEKFAVKVTWKNTPEIFIRLLSFSPEKLFEIREKLYGVKLLDTLLSKGKITWQKNFKLPEQNDYQQHSTEVLVDGLPAGQYLIAVSDNKDFSHNKHSVAYDFIAISNLSYIQRQQENSNYDFYILDRKNGGPVGGVEAQLFYRSYNPARKSYQLDKGKVYYSDNGGYFEVPSSVHGKKNFNFSIRFTKDNETLYSGDWYYSSYYNVQPPKVEHSTFFFTDRAIYRPGQTVYFKGIILKNKDKLSEIEVNYASKVELFDANDQKLSGIDVKTNDYGTFSGTFVIPQGLLTGEMQIKNEHGYITFSVEEYKRPGFEVSFPPFTGNYLLNDSVKIKGKAVSYAGSNLTGAIVNYRVIRNATSKGWRYHMYYTKDYEVAHGVTTTDDNGEFSLCFKAVPDLSIPNDKNQTFNFSILADVTDLNGETQSAEELIKVGYVSLRVDLPFPSVIDKSSEIDSVEVISQNFNNQPVPSAGKIAVFQLDDTPEPLRDRYWKQPDCYLYSQDEWTKLFKGNVYKDENELSALKKSNKVYESEYDYNKNKKIFPAGINGWKSGRYVAEISSTDAFGNPVSGKSYFTIFSKTESNPPYHTADWFVSLKAKAEPGDKAEFIIGTGAKNVKVLYEIEHQNRIVSQQWLNLKEEQKLVEVPVSEDYRGNFCVHFTFINNNRIYKHDELIYVPYTNKSLDIEFETFRNKLQPGQNEQWKIKLRGKNGERVAAELLASVYDASLDQFRENIWDFNIYRRYYIRLPWQANTFQSSNSMTIHENAANYKPVPPSTYDKLNWFGFYYPGNYYRGGKGEGLKKMLSKNAETIAAPMIAKDETTNVVTIAGESDKSGKISQEKEATLSEELTGIKSRTNFNESAFFYPHLQTDPEGNISLLFNLPESLTRWKMMGFAHTKDLKYGFTEKEFITQKDMMVMPNPPRFFREGDIIGFPVKISNLSGNDINGVAQIEFFDAVSMNPVKDIFMEGEQVQHNFTVKAGQNAISSWKIKIPEGFSAIGWKVSAKAGLFTDAAEVVTPVLTNRMLVIESLPLPIRGNETKDFEFTKLLNSGNSTTLRNNKLSLEFSSNPAWYAVQALPYMIEKKSDCSEAIFSRFYANALASFVANSSPKIKKVFDTWKNYPSSDKLISALEKNQELKSLLLEETPWVMAARSESEQKKRIALLFDLNKLAAEYDDALNKLYLCQLPDGGWSWFPDMPDDRFITQHIVSGFGHLQNLKVIDIKENARISEMIKKAVSYLDNQITKDYNYLKKQKDINMDENHLESYDIQYLYGRSYFREIEIPAKSKEAVDYYRGQAAQYWIENNKYLQGMIALALYRFSNDRTAGDIIASLKEHALHSEEMGMYWKDISAGYLWFHAPVETQALLIELFDEVANDRQSVEEMKIWLLKQKQTQNWRTTKATVEAVYALLLRGSDWLTSEEKVKVKLGETIVDPMIMPDLQVEAGTGYYKTSWSRNEIVPEMGKITVTNPNNTVAWGAVYWQYFEQLDKITPSTTPLNIVKKLYVEKNSNKGKVLVPVDEKYNLKIGDKVIVRVEIRTDRSMNYVHLKDMRASGFEPENVISRYKYQGGLGYYESTRDAATNFFISFLPKGTFVFEYPLRVSHAGDFSNGITSIQCMYAPEFTSNSEGIRVKVQE
jgi:hypothetical protein